MSRGTRATEALHRAGADFTLYSYDYDPDASRVGLQAAEALGEDPARVLKTLLASVDGRPVCAVLASDREVAMKKLAQTFGGKAAQMLRPADAERISGYKVGGVSPFGQRRLLPTAIDAPALEESYVYVNGGQRGLQLRIAPAVLVALLGAVAAPLAA